MDNRPIGVFDSGVGGLTVAKEILKNLPDEEIIYYGDTGRAPYGPRTTENITELTLQICDFLVEKGVKALVVACNTICVSCLEVLQKRYPVPVIGVIEPGVEAALEAGGQRIGLLATLATVASGAHRALLEQRKPGVEVYGKACPLFVPIIEEGFAETPIAFHAAVEYVKELLEKGTDTLILGCTHYPLMKEAVQKAAPGVTIVDPSYGTTMVLKEKLQQQDALREPERPTDHRFYMSGDQEKFDTILNTVFGRDYPTELHPLG